MTFLNIISLHSHKKQSKKSQNKVNSTNTLRQSAALFNGNTCKVKFRFMKITDGILKIAIKTFLGGNNLKINNLFDSCVGGMNKFGSIYRENGNKFSKIVL